MKDEKNRKSDHAQYCLTPAELPDDTTQHCLPPTIQSMTATMHTIPNIVIRGFQNLHHFLSWFQIDTRQPLIFPMGQERSIRQERDCIIISGFTDLEDFLAWFSHDHSRRPPVTKLQSQMNPGSDCAANKP